MDDGNLGVGAAPGPGCLKMPKLIDFLSGLILQDIVCSAFAFTQRTRYDFPSTSVNITRLYHQSYLAMYLELLHTSHSDEEIRAYTMRTGLHNLAGKESASSIL